MAKFHPPRSKPLSWESKVTHQPGSCMSSEDINHFCCMTWTCTDQATICLDKTRAGRLWTSTLIYLLHAAYSPYAMIHQIYLKSSRKPRREFSRNACDEQSKEEFSFWEKGTATSASRLREIFLEFTYTRQYTDNIMLTWPGIFDSFSVSKNYHKFSSISKWAPIKWEALADPSLHFPQASMKESRGREGQAALSLAGLPPFMLLRNSNVCFTDKKHCPTSIGFKEFICSLGIHPYTNKVKWTQIWRVTFPSKWAILKRIDQWSSGNFLKI